MNIFDIMWILNMHVCMFQFHLEHYKTCAYETTVFIVRWSLSNCQDILLLSKLLYIEESTFTFSRDKSEVFNRGSATPRWFINNVVLYWSAEYFAFLSTPCPWSWHFETRFETQKWCNHYNISVVGRKSFNSKCWFKHKMKKVNIFSAGKPSEKSTVTFLWP